MGSTGMMFVKSCVINSVLTRKAFGRASGVSFVCSQPHVQYLDPRDRWCSVEQSEYLSELLRDWAIPHNVLNARPKVRFAKYFVFPFFLFLMITFVYRVSKQAFRIR